MSKINPVKLTETLLKLVKEKEIILQRDAQVVLNKYISSASKKLDEQGKVKRYKIKVRQPMGNLNDLWLLCVNNIDYNRVIDYEKKMVNKDYKSPLKVNHFYKKGENPKNKFKNHDTGEVTIITNNRAKKIEPINNVIDMSEYVRINNNELEIKEYNGERVVTNFEIAKLHNKTVKAVTQQFERNKKHLILDEDYYVVPKENSKVTGCDFKKYFTSNRQKELILFTQSGYLMLVKSFMDDLSWKVQREIVNTYFKMKQLSQKNELQPISRNEIQSLDVLELMIKEMKKEKERVDGIEDKLDKIVNILAK